MGTPEFSRPTDKSIAAGTVAEEFARALAAAQPYVGATAPNPPVGCAILDAAGNLLATGAHKGAGQLHAEAEAISACRAAGTLARAHTLLVTLEPCAHHGRTPPCCDAILQTPIRQVWIGAEDPNAVAHGGAARLAAGGARVEWIGNLAHADAPALAAQAARLIAPFAKRVRTGRPWVTVKQALDADGGMIPPHGQTTFTSPDSLTYAHVLRRRADAILTGSGTVLADAPAFTVRHVPDIAGKRRHLTILDRRGRVSGHYLAAARARGFTVRVAESLDSALEALGAVGALEVLVEAGPQLTAAVLASEAWDTHVTIEKSQDPDTPDIITEKERLAADARPATQERM